MRNADKLALALTTAATLALTAGCPAPAQRPTHADAGPEPKLVPKMTPVETGPKPGDIPAPADVAAPPADAEKTASGLASKVLKPGTSDRKPTVQDSVEVHYTGWTTDGRMFDSSVKRNRTATFQLHQVVKGWTEGLQLMKEGETRRFWIPPELGYGEKPSRPGAPAGMLVFDVELIKVIGMPPTPPDVAAPPKDAKKTASGLVYKTLSPGTGTVHPTESDTVRVHYAGWTKDGTLFDASYKRGRTSAFPLKGVIKGWTEGVQLMTVGEKARFWIPAALAYGETATRPGAPSGDLTFEIELVEIVGK